MRNILILEQICRNFLLFLNSSNALFCSLLFTKCQNSCGGWGGGGDELDLGVGNPLFPPLCMNPGYDKLMGVIVGFKLVLCVTTLSFRSRSFFNAQGKLLGIVKVYCFLNDEGNPITVMSLNMYCYMY